MARIPARRLPKRLDARRAVMRAAYPWHDSDDIPEPQEDELPDLPWRAWTRQRGRR
jgi:hypothetical protein